MAKNYFTDEQVKEIAHKVDGYGLVEGGIFLSDTELKALMNLAVDTAIGEPVAWIEKRDSRSYGSDLYNNDIDYFNPDIEKLEPNDKLYSVKELDN